MALSLSGTWSKAAGCIRGFALSAGSLALSILEVALLAEHLLKVWFRRDLFPQRHTAHQPPALPQDLLHALQFVDVALSRKILFVLVLVLVLGSSMGTPRRLL